MLRRSEDRLDAPWERPPPRESFSHFSPGPWAWCFRPEDACWMLTEPLLRSSDTLGQHQSEPPQPAPSLPRFLQGHRAQLGLWVTPPNGCSASIESNSHACAYREMRLTACAFPRYASSATYARPLGLLSGSNSARSLNNSRQRVAVFSLGLEQGISDVPPTRRPVADRLMNRLRQTQRCSVRWRA